MPAFKDGAVCVCTINANGRPSQKRRQPFHDILLLQKGMVLNMYNVNPYQQYQQNSIKSADRGKLTLILYENAAKFIKQAIRFIDQNKPQESHKAIIKSQEIITYLSDTLNMDYDIAKNLYTLYEYMTRRLVEGNIKKDKAILTEVLDLVADLRETWREAMRTTVPPLALGL